MKAVIPIARAFFAIAMVAFGIQHFIYGTFVTRIAPEPPAWIPWHPFWAYVAGAVLIVAGIAILSGKGARAAAVLLGVLVLLGFLLLYVPRIAVAPPLGGLWTNAGKALALSGGAFLVAGSLTRQGTGSSLLGWLDRLIPLGRFFVGAFLILGGVQHFLFTTFVASLVPAWIPGHLFWTYFAGLALIAGGAGMMIPPTMRLAAFLSGIMIFLWVLTLHIPRAIAAPHDSNETTAMFEALAISGAAFLVAAMSRSPVKAESPIQ